MKKPTQPDTTKASPEVVEELDVTTEELDVTTEELDVTTEEQDDTAEEQGDITEELKGPARIDAIFALSEAKENPSLARRLAYSSGMTVKEAKAALSK